MKPLALSSITIGSNFELAQIRLGDGKAMRFIDEYIFFNFAVLSISGSAWTALDSMFELSVPWHQRIFG